GATLLTRGDVKFGRDDHVEVLRLDGVRVVLRELVAEHLVPDALGTELRLDQSTGNMPWTKARHLHLATQSRQCFFLRPDDIGLVDLNRELYLVAFEYFG